MTCIKKHQSNQLYLASVKKLLNDSNPSVNLWGSFYGGVISHNVPLIDRSNLLVMPYNFKIYEPFRMPNDLSNFNLTYEHCCEKRAEELLELSKKTSKSLLIFYSGGIDSTLVLISFLKIATKDDIRDRIIVAMTPESIQENPNFYYEHVLPNFRLKSSEQFGDLFLEKYIIVGGEHNDQLFGSDIIGRIDAKLGFQRVLEPYEKGLMRDWFSLNRMTEKQASWWFDLMVWHANNSPCEIKTTFDLFWWMNFNFKWQSVFFRMLLRVSADLRKNINQEYVDNCFKHFFSGEDFQKWSMLNPHLKIRDSWQSYKYHAKDLIYKFTKDSTYSNQKLKKGSLYKIFLSKDTPVGLTVDYEYLYSLERDYFYNPTNSFDISMNFK
jgi:hypothetical protein